MILLKNYQQEALDTLTEYFDNVAQTHDARKSFIDTLYNRFKENRDYRAIEGFDANMPYVCLRLPTGGGKTLLACHSIRIAKDNLLKQDHACVLWLVPSDPIRVQTLNALKNPNHPYRQALDSTLGEIEVREIKECFGISKATLDGATTIIVSTLQSFRVENEEGRKAYRENGSLMSHFSGLDSSVSDKLLKDENGLVEYSFANVLRMRHPIVIVDEAHNARSSLSFDMLRKFSPSAIIEFTATPSKGTKKNTASNVLHHVSARELYTENMIKLPIRLEVKRNWKDTLNHAISELNVLSELAKLEKINTQEYIRPIMLIKAQNREQAHPENITTDVIEKYLLEECNIPKQEVAMEAYERSESKGKDLLSPDCKIRYIITVDSLKEGWDCPFAYVLCSLANQSSETAVEQILGRILRLPHVTKKQSIPLNCAYAFSVSDNFQQAATALRDSLIENGFEKMEADDFVPEQEQTTLPLKCSIPKKTCSLKSNITTNGLSQEAQETIEFNPETKELIVTAVVSPEVEEEILGLVSNEEDKETIKTAIAQHRTQTEEIFSTPAEKSEPFKVPTLGVLIQGEFELLDTDTRLFDSDWNILDYKDSPENFAFDPNRKDSDVVLGTIDEDGKVKLDFTSDIQQDLNIITPAENWSESQLVSWLDRNILHPDTDRSVAIAFIVYILNGAIKLHNAKLSDFIRERWGYVKFVRGLFQKHKNTSESSYFGRQLELLINSAETPLSLSENNSYVFNFDPDKYPVNKQIENTFKKHYYKQVADLNAEELECAHYIDNLPEVKYWVRNIEQKVDTSFWLPTAKGRFYPDFVCKLNDGRILVVEYKGEHLVSNEDSKVKKIIGNLWAERSNGRCLFIMAEKDSFRAEIPKIIKLNK